MAKLFYPAVLEKEPRSAYGLIFPDFPGLVSAGHSPEQALIDAHEALADAARAELARRHAG